MECRKIQHRTKESANEHLKKLKKYSRKNKKLINKMGVYVCPKCLYWHVGTNKFKRKRKIWIASPPFIEKKDKKCQSIKKVDG